MIEKGAVFPMFYLAPVAYFSKLNGHKPNITFESQEHFPKQTYRNRANIYSPDGPLSLTVPVIKGSKVHTRVKDVKISYDFNWQRLHWMSLETCYRRSAYFEYYEDDFAALYQKKFEFLFDLNEEMLQLILKFLKLSLPLQYTETYQAAYPDLGDYRNAFSAKQDYEFDQKPYFQVFEDRGGFIKNLSIVDLLFSQGPQAPNYL